jgi:hypothetical protein
MKNYDELRKLAEAALEPFATRQADNEPFGEGDIDLQAFYDAIEKPAKVLELLDAIRELQAENARLTLHIKHIGNDALRAENHELNQDYYAKCAELDIVSKFADEMAAAHKVERDGLLVKNYQLMKSSDLAWPLVNSAVRERDELSAKLAALQSDDELPEISGDNVFWALENPKTQDILNLANNHARDAQAMLRAKLARQAMATKCSTPEVCPEHAHEFYLAAGAAPQAQPIYQLQLGDGEWIDQNKESYDYNVKHGQATVRIVYAAGAALQPAQDVNAIMSLARAWYLSDSTEAALTASNSLKQAVTALAKAASQGE